MRRVCMLYLRTIGQKKKQPILSEKRFLNATIVTWLYNSLNEKTQRNEIWCEISLRLYKCVLTK